MKVVNDNLRGDLSLVDKVWNDAMETAALYCEDLAHTLFARNGDSDQWVWPAGRTIRDMAEAFRKEKRR